MVRNWWSKRRPGASYRPQVDCLEERLVMTRPAPPPTPTPAPPVAHPPIIRLNPLGSPTPPASAYTPAQIKQAYCINMIKFGKIQGDGTGQTIAIVDAYDNPKLVSSTAAGFLASDLHQFDVQFGLPDPPSFLKLDQTGGMAYPPTDPAGAGNNNFEAEAALDCEWAHALAPGAKIILVETTDNTFVNLLAGVAFAKTIPGVVTVSMSFGGGEFAAETANDATFTTPAGHPGVTFLASTGDNGAPGGFPAYSPNVVAVGGTTLTATGAGNYVSETGWSGSGGGISKFEKQPAFQNGSVTQSNTQRTIPDVAFDADPNTGVPIYDSYNDVNKTGPWVQIGGTSFSCPAWAAIITIADQGRAIYGKSSLDGPTQTLPDLYAIYKNPTQYATDFHDILTGNNGFAASVGYDLVTGIGSPIACFLVPDLVGPIPPPVPKFAGKISVFYPFRYLFNPTNNTYSGNLTLTNTTANAQPARITVVFTGLPRGVFVDNATTTVGGFPAITINSGLPTLGLPVRVPIRLFNPFHVPLSTFFEGFQVKLLFGT